VTDTETENRSKMGIGEVAQRTVCVVLCVGRLKTPDTFVSDTSHNFPVHWSWLGREGEM